MCSAMSGCYCSPLFIFTLSDPDPDIANTCGHYGVQWLNAFKSNQNILQEMSPKSIPLSIGCKERIDKYINSIDN